MAQTCNILFMHYNNFFAWKLVTFILLIFIRVLFMSRMVVMIFKRVNENVPMQVFINIVNVAIYISVIVYVVFNYEETDEL